MEQVSFIIPVVNNFEYTKHVYENLKSYFPDDEIVISDGGSTDETVEYFNNINDSNLVFLNNGKLNLCENYNCGVRHSTNDIVILLHNDMFIPPNFKQRILAKLTKENIMSYARIEPPVFPGEEPGKVVRDFGFDLDTLNVPAIIEFSEQYNLTYEGGGYLFIACYKSNWIGLDEKTFSPPQMWTADDDLHLRFRLSKFSLIISDAIVYHFVSKTSRSTDDYQLVELTSNRNFIRKWGMRHAAPKYNIAYRVTNCSIEFLEFIEPWGDRIYIEDDSQGLISQYLHKEQKNTSYDLNTRVFTTSYNDPIGENDIVVSVEATRFTEQDFMYIQQLPLIIQNSGESGEFKLGNLHINIVSIIEYQNDLISL